MKRYGMITQKEAGSASTDFVSLLANISSMRLLLHPHDIQGNVSYGTLHLNLNLMRIK